jgi:hypothetical protein
MTSTDAKNTYSTLIEKYQHLFTKDEKRPLAKFKNFECSIGWYKILEHLISHIDHYFKHKYKGVPPEFSILQVKEKFGGLRVYIQGGDDVVYELIRFTEGLALNTCEFCGSNQNIKHSRGYMSTACPHCIETVDRLKGREWFPKEEHPAFYGLRSN